MQNKSIIIFSGYNQRSVIAFLRTLKKHNVLFGIIAAHNNDLIFESEYKENVIVVRKSVELNIEDIISSINIFKTKIKSNEYIVAPSTEALNRFVLKNRFILEKNNIIIPLVDETLYINISDKKKFSDLCVNNAIEIPTELFDVESLNIPFVAKPKTYFDSTGIAKTPYLILTQENKRKFIIENDINEFYYQEFITGRSFYILFYIDKNGKTYKFSQENIIQQPGGKSIIAAISSDIHGLEITNKYEKLLHSVNFHGLIMIEVIKIEEKFKMIEANPRFWGPSQLFVDAGVNFFELFLSDFGLIETKIKSTEPLYTTKYFWFGGVVQTLRAKEQLKFHNYTELDFLNNLHNWLEFDIYKRNDTYKIFKKELI